MLGCKGLSEKMWVTISERMWAAFGFSFASDWLKKRCKSLWSIMEYLRAVLSWIAFELPINPLTPMSDQVRISPSHINIISTRWVMRIKKNITLGIIAWSNTKFSKLQHYKNCMVDSKENGKFDLGGKGIRMLWSLQKKLFYLICCINKYFQLHLTVNGYDWFGILKMFVCNLFDNNYCLIYQDQFRRESLQLHTSNNLLFLISWRLFSNQLWVVNVDADIWIPKSSLLMWSC